MKDAGCCGALDLAADTPGGGVQFSGVDHRMVLLPNGCRITTCQCAAGHGKGSGCDTGECAFGTMQESRCFQNEATVTWCRSSQAGWKVEAECCADAGCCDTCATSWETKAEAIGYLDLMAKGTAQMLIQCRHPLGLAPVCLHCSRCNLLRSRFNLLRILLRYRQAPPCNVPRPMHRLSSGTLQGQERECRGVSIERIPAPPGLAPSAPQLQVQVDSQSGCAP